MKCAILSPKLLSFLASGILPSLLITANCTHLYLQRAHPTHTPTLASQLGSRAAVAGIAVLGLTFVIAVFRQVSKFQNPKAVRQRTMNKNKASPCWSMPHGISAFLNAQIAEFNESASSDINFVSDAFSIQHDLVGGFH